MRNLSKICLLIIVSMTLSGCSLKFWEKKTAGPEGPEVLLAQECGLDGLKCCETEPSCTYGQKCCSDPNNPKRNQCADDCGLGGLGQFCKPDKTCNDGFRCLAGLCLACGNEGEPCCDTAAGASACTSAVKSWGGELVCYQEQCVACGEPGSPCCSFGETCRLPAGARGRAECSSGLCNLCGSDSQAVCLAGGECEPGNLVNNGGCISCGQINQPCCRGSNGAAVCAAPELACELGFCQR